MNTDTPRTDAEVYTGHGCGIVKADFARQLERELHDQIIKKSELFVECGRRGERIAELERELNEAVSRGKLEALNYTQEERERFGRWCAQNNDFLSIKAARDQLQRELNEAKTINVIASQTLDELQPVLNKLLTDRDRWRTMAQVLGEELKRRHGWHVLEQGADNEHCGVCDLISRFNELNQ